MSVTTSPTGTDKRTPPTAGHHDRPCSARRASAARTSPQLPQPDASHAGPSKRHRQAWRHDYAPVAASVREAREGAAAHLGSHRISPEAAHDALLVLSELVANAVRHGGRPGRGLPVRVEVRVEPDTVRVEVSDNNADPPAPTSAPEEDEGHRGLLIVQRLALRWGFRPRPVSGKTVWALVSAQ